ARGNPAMTRFGALRRFVGAGPDDQLATLRLAVTALRTAAARARELLRDGRIHPLDLPAAVRAAGAAGHANGQFRTAVADALEELAAPGRAKKTVRDAPALRHGYADVVVDLFTYRFPTRGTTTQAAYDGLDATLRATVQAVREATDRDLFDAYRTARGRRHEYHTARRAGHD